MSKQSPVDNERLELSFAPSLTPSQKPDAPPVASSSTHRASPIPESTDPVTAIALPRSPRLRIWLSATSPSTSPTPGRQHSSPSTREAMARPLTGAGTA